MELPEDFLNEFDLTIQHGNFDKTKELINVQLQRFDGLESHLKKEIVDFSQLNEQELLDYFITHSAWAEFLGETSSTQETIKFANKYLNQIDEVISSIHEKSGKKPSQLLLDYLKFARTEYMRTLVDANRRLGNLEEIDRILDKIDTILEPLCIPKNTPRYIKSRAYNRNFKAIQKWNYGKPEEAKKLFLQCIDDFNLLKAPADVAMIYNNIGLIYLMKGDFHGAINYFEKTLNYFQDKENTYLVATLLNNIGEAYREIGNIPQALSYHEETLKLRKSIGRESDIGQSYLFLGSLYMAQGELDKALENFIPSLNIYKEINDELNIARLLYNLGEVYLDRGQFQQAENYYHESISYLGQSNNPIALADSYMSLGIIEKEKGDFDRALNKFRESEELRKNVGNQVQVAISQCEMVECFILQGKMDLASNLLGEIEQVVNKYPEHTILFIYFNLMQGIYFQHAIRARQKIKAENLFREVLTLPVIPYKLEVRTNKQLIKLLLEELQNYGEEVVLAELLEFIDKLETLAKRQTLLLVLVEIYLIRHQLQLLLGKSEVSKEYLYKATEIVNSLEVPILSQKLDQISTFYDQNMKLWKGLDQLNLALSDRLKLSIVSSSLKNSQELLHLYQNNTGQSIMIIIFNETGTISFSYHFTAYQKKVKNKINPHLIASFISALNSFGRDTFETSELLETLTYGHHKLVSRRMGSNILSLLYEGTKLQVHQQLIDFEQFLQRSGIFSFIEKYPNQQFNVEDQHVKIIENIFN